MRWRDARRSSNIENGGSGGGMRFGGGGGLGIGGIAAVVVISLILGKNPLEMLGLVNSVVGGGGPVATQNAEPSAENNANRDFVAAILGETEDVWGAIFQQSNAQYEQPKLVLFSGVVQTACGGASSASGPFYCPGDHKVYLDTSFFDEMRAKLGGGGDFAEAYVIAHEVGHHVQTLVGVSAKVNAARQAGKDVKGDGGLLVRQELQADCYAGLWAHHAQQRHNWLEAGDIEEAMNTATAIGDDRLQKQSQGEVVPDAFTHGTAAQRVRWFTIGFEKGDVGACDTFASKQL
ncbi:MAG: neutral zinc metallopeptidase [Stagnimonas sp.]|nr:neutral zinc metallopeptidase [Stagnimonas sp.]